MSEKQETLVTENIQLLKLIYQTLDEKKAEDITILDIHELTCIADFFVITNGSNINQVHALSDYLVKKMAELGKHERQIEGYQGANWILLDYGDIIIHIFDQESRGFYDLEHIWNDAKKIDLSK